LKFSAFFLCLPPSPTTIADFLDPRLHRIIHAFANHEQYIFIPTQQPHFSQAFPSVPTSSLWSCITLLKHLFHFFLHFFQPSCFLRQRGERRRSSSFVVRDGIRSSSHYHLIPQQETTQTQEGRHDDDKDQIELGSGQEINNPNKVVIQKVPSSATNLKNQTAASTTKDDDFIEV